MGRVKIDIKKLEPLAHRKLTFGKRSKGFIKKVYELSVLCDVNIGVIMFSPTGKLIQFSRNNKIEDDINCFINNSPLRETRNGKSKKNIQDLDHVLQKLKDERDMKVHDMEMNEEVNDGENDVEVNDGESDDEKEVEVHDAGNDEKIKELKKKQLETNLKTAITEKQEYENMSRFIQGPINTWTSIDLGNAEIDLKYNLMLVRKQKQNLEAQEAFRRAQS